MPRRAAVRAIERKDGRSARWGISIPCPGKSAKRVYFSTKKQRDVELEKARRIAAVEGTGALSMSAADVQLVRDLREILPEGVDPREAARLWLEVQGVLSACSLHEASREYRHGLQLRRLSLDHQDHVKRALDALELEVGPDALVSSIVDDALAGFFARLPFKPRTLANYQQYIRSFFVWAVKRGYCRRSPMESIGKVSVPESEAEFMPVSDVRKFFEGCAVVRPEGLPFFALSFFAGFRSSTLLRLRREDIRFDERGVLLPGASHKSGRRFYVEGFEANLWRWLEPWRALKELPCPPASTLINWRRLAYERAGVEFPHNAGRHSFCSYHVALHGDASKTATLLTHRGSVSMLYNHYRGNATRADAVEFFKILP